MKSKKHYIKQTLLHLFFWCAVLFIFTLVFSTGNTLDVNTFYFSVFLMPITIGTTYISIYKLIPDYLITKRYALFSLYTFYTVIISIFCIMFSVFFGLAFLTDFKFTEVVSLSRNTIFIISCIYLVVIIVSAFKLLKLNLKQSKHNAELEAKILEAQLKLKQQELSYLKMQIHPHFLFNTLNTLYGFALKKSETTPDLILKLSNLLDYVLYQVNKPLVELKDEINHIKDYISLEQMRFNDTLNIDFKSDNCINNLEIAPMLFLPFVENSFKHGKIVNGTLKISIAFKCDNEHIDFSITNSHQNNQSTKNGIGLENIKKRLELLYKNDYDLDISETKNNYSVQLKLHLNNG
ncbi:sensor histidine kinase [Winogradskyella immobilis]|uniref:sensor histidine kinase n=1 Tax=Winogradskyella immobilis TaxID=2816852 RepID=UPI001D0CD178|nr:histidine kinase [Winogradskyella immobilis]MCG0015745.1 histidine kinase [Winogradskyella immobilis]